MSDMTPGPVDGVDSQKEQESENEKDQIQSDPNDQMQKDRKPRGDEELDREKLGMTQDLADVQPEETTQQNL